MIQILVVDDEILVRAGIRTLLPWAQLGFNITMEASCGEDALECCQKNRPDIVFTDIKMPGMGGLELIENIKDQWPAIKCVVLSCYDELDLVKRAMLLGASGYFSKLDLNPDEITRLLMKLKQQINETKTFAMDRNRDETMGREKLEQFSQFFLFRFQNELPPQRKAWLDKSLPDVMSSIMKRYSMQSRIFSCDNWEYMMGCVREDGGCLAEKDAAKLCRVLQENIKLCFNLDAEVQHRSQPWNLVKKSGTAQPVAQPKQISQMLQNLVLAVDTGLETESHKQLELIFSAVEQSLEQEKKVILELYFRFENLLRNYHETLDSFFDNDFVQAIMSCEEHREIEQIVFDFTADIIRILNKLKGNTYRSDIEQVIRYLEQHLDEKVTLETVAGLVSVNSTYLSRLFKKETGVGFVEYLTTLRVKRSQQYLQDKNLTLAQISMKVGFEDVNYFGKVFKKYCEITPSEYREGKNGPFCGELPLEK